MRVGQLRSVCMCMCDAHSVKLVREFDGRWINVSSRCCSECDEGTAG